MLEDSSDDASLIQKTLQRADVAFEAKVVASRDDFVKALASFSPDLILSDHQLPQFSSTEALEICRRSFPFLPFILVTGTVSEEFAASIIRAGADDYLLKNNLKRLPTAIRQAIERKKTEQSLVQSNERYELVSKATSDAIWDWNIVNDTITWNHGLKTLFGYEPISMADTDRLWRDKIHPDDHGRVLEEMNKVFSEQGDSWISFYRYRHINGNYRHVFDRAHVLYEKGKPIRMIGAMEDVNDRIKTLEEVKRLSIVASKTDNSVLILDKDFRIEWVNDSFTRSTGYPLQEVIGKRPFEFLYGPESNSFIERKIIENEKILHPFTEEILNYAKDGRKHWVRVTITPIFNEKGALDKFIAIQSDVTEQKEFEKNITAIAREFTSLIENANVPIFGIDRNGYVNEWNRITAEITEYTKNEVLEKKWIDILDPSVHEKVRDIIKKVYTGESTRNIELPFVSKSGKNLVILMSISPRLDGNKNIKGAICVGQDISEVILYRQGLEKLVEERTRELHEALRKEKELVEMKNKFVSIASHEFRTPISTISFAAESIRNYFHQLTAEEIQRKLIKIEDQASHMTNLLEDILTLGKSEAGKIKVKRISIDLKEFIDSLIEEVRSTVKEKREINFTFSCVNSKVNVDDKLLRNVVNNLLTNALKFSGSNTTVTIAVADFEGNISIEVTDEGIGIDESELTSVFESFQRGSNASDIQGTGLGLSILKKAVELMNGSIKVRSSLNVGSTFSVRIPIK